MIESEYGDHICVNEREEIARDHLIYCDRGVVVVVRGINSLRGLKPI